MRCTLGPNHIYFSASDIEINTDPEWWPDVDGLALDGFVVLRLVTPGAGDTFQHYAVSFINYIDRNCNKVDRVDVVWGSRGTGIRAKVRTTSMVPTNCQGFLRVTSNISELVDFLAENIQRFHRQGKIVVSTVGERTVSSSAELNHSYISPRTHEEADYRLMLHVEDMARNNIQIVCIRTDDV